MQDKIKIRQELLAKRLRLTKNVVNTRSNGMCGFLEAWIKSKHFSEIFLFHPFRNEPDLTPLIDRCAVAVHMPVVVSQSEMQFFRVDAQTVYQQGKWGILEPVRGHFAQPVEPGKHSLIVMPALAVDRQGHRLGYGGGFYDRFLQQHDSVLMAALFDEFVVANVPVEVHDVRVNYVLTESGIDAIAPV